MLTHGTRGCYVNQRCRCLLCRAATAKAKARERVAQANGRLALGHRVSAVESRRLIRLLGVEGYSKGEIAWALGLQRERRAVRRTRGRLTLRRQLRIRKLFREWVTAGNNGSDVPIEVSHSASVATCDKKNDGRIDDSE